MKTKKAISALSIIFLANVVLFYASAQKINNTCKTYFPTVVGSVLEYKVDDIKNSNKGTIKQTVADVVDTENGLKIIVRSERIDENIRIDQKGEHKVSGTIEMRCEGGVFYTDVRSLLDSKTSMYKSGDSKLSGVDLQFPANMSPGQSLPDAEISIGAEVANLPIPPITISVTNRKVMSTEKVSTPSGTFECYKIECEVEMHPVVSSYLRIVQWISEGIGTVKSETYDENGKLVSKMILTKLTNKRG